MNYAESGARYEGDFVRNERHGHGVLTESDGDEYSGCFYEDKRHGTGHQTYRWPFSSLNCALTAI